MNLPLHPPFPPMEAEPADEIPSSSGWHYEPKWDGFRCIAFRDGREVEIESKATQSLTRYFPELVEALQALKAARFVLDGEIVIPIGGKLSFEALLLRIHPAATRVTKLSCDTPALLLAFDLLVNERGKSLVDQPLSKRRAGLESFAARFFSAESRIRLSPATTSLDEARGWFRTMGGGLDGIVAKRFGDPYRSGERSDGMLKIKDRRTADCVVGGFRYAAKDELVGSLLLGLYDSDGRLNHVGFTSGIPAKEKPDLTKRLESLIEPPGFTGRAPGGPSRWSRNRPTEWQPLRPILVVEVEYDHFTGGRFRHGTRLVHWRPDKSPRQCTLAQVERESRSPLTLLDPAPHLHPKAS